MVEGAHLVSACLESGRVIKSVMLSTTGAGRPELAALAGRIGTPVKLSDAVFRSIAGTETPAGIAAEIALPAEVPDLKAAASSVFLEGIQDPGNVGAILRSAAAFGIADAVLDVRCADAWSPKVLRAAMGAHFGMQIAERADLAKSMERFAGKIACAVPRGGIPLTGADQFNYNTFKAGLRNESAFSFTFTLAGLGSFGSDQFSQLGGGQGGRRRGKKLRPDRYDDY